jgi:uncharacterized protein YutE (UPF0331/DUF86 family)
MVAEKLESLRRCVARIEARRKASVEALQGDVDAEGWLSHELAGRLRAAVGFRKLAVHAYDDLDWSIVHRLTTEGVNDLRAFAAAIARRLA